MQNFLITRVSKQFRPRDVKDPAYFRELDELHIHASQELQARLMSVDMLPNQISNTLGGHADEVLYTGTIKAGIFDYNPISRMSFDAYGTIVNSAGVKDIYLFLNATQLAHYTLKQNKANAWTLKGVIFNYAKTAQKAFVRIAEDGEVGQVAFVSTAFALYDLDFTLSLHSRSDNVGDIKVEIISGTLLRKEAGA